MARGPNGPCAKCSIQILPVVNFKLEGKRVFSIGTLPMDKYELRSLLSQQQGRLMTGISKKLDFIIKGEKPTAKQLEKARAAGVPIISFEKFWTLVDEAFTRFDLSGLSGSLSPEDLLTQLKQKNWALFSRLVGKAEAGALVSLLREHEAAHGTTEVHHFCSEQLQKEHNLELLHPFHHTAPIRNHDLSPNGQFLVTSSDANTEFEDRRAIVQVWDVELGQPINQFSIRGGVGTHRCDEIMSGLQWSPDSKLIGMNKSLNGIAVYKPNGARLSEASITNGIAYAIGFSWAQDSQRVMIHWPYYEKLDIPEDEDPEQNITWMPAEIEPPRGTNHRESEKKCVPGMESDYPIVKKRRSRKQLIPDYQGLVEHEKENTYYRSPHALVVVKPRSVSFVKPSGERKDFPQYDWNPIGNQSKTQRFYSISPLFPVDDNRSHFGKLLEDNALFVPADYPYQQYITASICRTHAWPLDWIPSIPIREEDTDEKW